MECKVHLFFFYDAKVIFFFDITEYYALNSGKMSIFAARKSNIMKKESK